ncbi:hypothetical protein [Rhizobium sp. Leaf386]|uniref:hypothetical protein n=1 Tax=Rhizobium sp. Leaf386 TaxID=1736359 RepID=UPI000715C374|nr:hypothetical protein [Rhizobium sp. Leaf386]KQS84148.1 hypothetical protein ASG50_30130 [Rhizobium sp. Leaf386]
MADQLKDQRVVTLMTPAELKSIDDWSFENRIRSRGEAIRRLCQMGVLADAKRNVLQQGSLEMADKVLAISQKIRGTKRVDPDVSKANAELAELFTSYFEKITELGFQLQVLTDDDPVSETMQFAHDVLNEIKAQLAGGGGPEAT